jgi:hypothetical protein
MTMIQNFFKKKLGARNPFEIYFSIGYCNEKGNQH